MLRPLLISILLTSTSIAETLLVPEEYKTIQLALDASEPGDTIDLASGTWYNQIAWGLSGVTLKGREGGSTIIDGSKHIYSPVVCYGEPVTIENIKFQNGAGSNIFGLIRGGAIYVEFTSATIRNCQFESNQINVGDFDGGSIGGAICSYYGSLVIDSCTFNNNHCNGLKSDDYGNIGGAIGIVNGDLSIDDCEFTNNSATMNGGAIFAGEYSNCSVNNCTFSKNVALNGGAMSNNESDINLMGCVFQGNIANTGGGMHNYKSNTALLSCEFKNNNAKYGGGLYNYNNAIMLAKTIICGNTPDQIVGDWIDNGKNTIAADCGLGCPDINDDGMINVNDLLTIIDQWGLTNSPADVTQDGAVDVSDLLLIISNWGTCK